ncbi:MAG: LysR family transcriptional regulator, partial [Oscillospiraceae bacterium]
MIDVRIQTFLALCEDKSYTKTAQRLFITQPTVTQHIQYLEKRFCKKLFCYRGK